MTTPLERTRALRFAGETLQELLRSGNITPEQRQSIEVTLRHYPNALEIQALAQANSGQEFLFVMLEPEQRDPS